MAKESNKERALTLEAIRVLDAIDRRGSLRRRPTSWACAFGAELHGTKAGRRADAMLFDRSGHRTKFTLAGRMLLERGRCCWRRPSTWWGDRASPVAGDRHHHRRRCLDAGTGSLPLVDRLAEQTDTRLRFRAEVLAGSWECLEDGRADLLISSSMPISP